MRWFLALMLFGAVFGCSEYCVEKVVKPGSPVTVKYVYPGDGKDSCGEWSIRSTDGYPIKIQCTGKLLQTDDCASSVTISSGNQRTTSEHKKISLLKWIDKTDVSVKLVHVGQCKGPSKTLTCVFTATKGKPYRG